MDCEEGKGSRPCADGWLRSSLMSAQRKMDTMSEEPDNQAQESML